jgi:D-alanyl-D-alanine dipeptidase
VITGRPSKIGSPEPIAALNRVKILELDRPWHERERLVDVRVHCPDVVWSERICPYLRESVANRLNQAQSTLPPGYRLKAGTALRTLSMQKGGWDGYFKRIQEEHPTWPLSALRRATNKFFAPYDQPAPPGHCTGGAVDVGLIDAEGVGLDLTSPTKGWEGAYTWSEKLSPEAKANRMIMVEAMLGAGFSNCRDEFWHYSWGDSAWAVRVGERECPYGWAHPPVALETDFTRARAEILEVGTTRDFHGRALRAAARLAVPLPDADPEAPLLAVGLYWAKQVPVDLEVHLPPLLPEPPPLYLGDGGERWELLTGWERQGNRLRLEVTPLYDRAVLTDRPPPPSEAK